MFYVNSTYRIDKKCAVLIKKFIVLDKSTFKKYVGNFDIDIKCFLENFKMSYNTISEEYKLLEGPTAEETMYYTKCSIVMIIIKIFLIHFCFIPCKININRNKIR